MIAIAIAVIFFIIAFLLGQNFLSTFYTIASVAVVGFLIYVFFQTFNQRELSKLVKFVTIVICIFTFLCGIKPTLDKIRGKIEVTEQKAEKAKQKVDSIERFVEKFKK